MFSLLWSEHCAYKHSKKLLRTLPTEGPRGRHGPGRERRRGRRRRRLVGRLQGRVAQPPVRGRAVPGRGHRRRRDPARHLRDRRAADRGARLAALRRADVRALALPARPRGRRHRPLRQLDRRADDRRRGLLRGARTRPNCLVNAMALGLARDRRHDPQRRGGRRQRRSCCSARRPGATASAARRCWPRPSSATSDEAKRPTVQVGDPFEEKKLLECSLELLERGLLVALQDLGAAGLTSARREMASKGEVGLDLDVAQVPLREADMEPFEIMVSESQERMLCVCEPGERRRGARACARSGRSTAPRSATVTDTRPHARPARRRGRRRHAGRRRSSTTARSTTSRPSSRRAPACTRRPRATLARRRRRPRRRCSRCSPRRTSPRAARCSSSTTAIVQSRTVRRPEEADAAVLALPDGARASRVVDRRQRPPRRRRPVQRARSTAVLECAANLACVGAEPLGMTNNLNFGNPEKPHIAWQLTEAVRGLGDACRALDAPVVGGNVSLYNEGADGPDLPDAGRRHGRRAARRRAAPAARASRARATRSRSPAGTATPSLAASELAKLRGERAARRRCPPSTSTTVARGARRDPRRGARGRRCPARHDVAEGGFLVAVAEAAWPAGSARRSTSAPPSDVRWTQPLRRGRPAASSSRARARRSSASASASRSTSSATVGGDALRRHDRRARRALDARRAARGPRRAGAAVPLAAGFVPIAHDRAGRAGSASTYPGRGTPSSRPPDPVGPAPRGRRS